MTPEAAELVEANLKIVYVIAQGARKKLVGSDYDDLVGDGMIGLCEAAVRYEPRGFTFMSFAKSRILGAMIDGYRKRTGYRRGPCQPGRAVPRADLEHLLATGWEPADPRVNVEDEVISRIEHDRIRVAVDALPDRQRRAVDAYTERGGSVRLASEDGVTQAAISHRRRTVARRLAGIEEGAINQAA